MSRPEQAEPAGKVAQIIVAAREAFFELGYDADEVAKRAGQADGLFLTIRARMRFSLAVYERERCRFDQVLEAQPIITPGLRALGLELLQALLSPSVRALHRVTVMAAHGFPGLGQSIYAGGSMIAPTYLANPIIAIIS